MKIEVILVLLLLTLPAISMAGIIKDEISADNPLLDNPHWEILVVTVEEISNENSTKEKVLFYINFED